VSYLDLKEPGGLEHDMQKAGDGRVLRPRGQSARTYTAKADCLNPSHVDKMPLYRPK